MSTTNMFGKTYNTVGSSDSNFIIKTKGDLKVQWGGKYIDIIKNGKLASAKTNFFKEVESEDSIIEDGIYLVEDLIWISVGGTKVNIASASTEDMYVSFVQELPKVTSDLKYTSLTNAGFYYESLEDAKQANLTKGLIYIEKEHLLYYINNGIITKYVGTIPDSSNKFKELFIESLHIFLDFALVVFESEIPIVFKLKKLPIVQINNDNLEINLTTIIHGDIVGDTYKLYSKDGQSYLEVDNIITKSNDISKEHQVPLEWIYADNIIIAQTIKNTSEENVNILTEYPITCKTIYKNTYKNGDSIYLLMDNSATLSYSNTGYYLSYPVPVDIVLKVGEQTITIPKNTTEFITDQGSEEYEIIQGLEYLNLDSYKNKLGLWKFVVSNCTETEFTISLPVDDNSFVSRCLYISTCLADKPLLTINNEIKYSEKNKVRTIIGDVSNIDINSIKSEELTHGIFSENLISINGKFYDSTFKIVQEYPKYDPDAKLPLNASDAIYNSVIPNLQWVKLLIDSMFPIGSIIMFNGTDIPDGWAICDGNNGTPNLIGRFIKAGNTVGVISSNLNENNELTLTEDNLPSHSHPHEKHKHSISISNATGSISQETVTTSSTPSTFAYYLPTTEIKAVTGVEVTEPPVEGLEQGTPMKVALTKDTALQSIDINYRAVEASGSHKHTLTIDTISGDTTSVQSIEATKNFANNPIKIEPRAYSLIFIMKIK